MLCKKLISYDGERRRKERNTKRNKTVLLDFVYVCSSASLIRRRFVASACQKNCMVPKWPATNYERQIMIPPLLGHAMARCTMLPNRRNSECAAIRNHMYSENTDGEQLMITITGNGSSISQIMGDG